MVLIRNDIMPSLQGENGTTEKLADMMALNGDLLRDFCSAPCSGWRS